MKRDQTHAHSLSDKAREGIMKRAALRAQGVETSIAAMAVEYAEKGNHIAAKQILEATGHGDL